MKGNLQGFFQRRLQRFGLDMIVVGVCFCLYYLGFFGGTTGPLNPSHIGDNLHHWGVTKAHLLGFFICLALVTIAWNWIFNLFSFRLGRRLTCSRIDDRGEICLGAVSRRAIVQRKSRNRLQHYVCVHGHSQPDARFHPLEKGTLGHMLWVIAVIFVFIVFYASYC